MKKESPVLSGLLSDPSYSITRYIDDRSARVTDIGLAGSDSYAKKNKQIKTIEKLDCIDKLAEIALRGSEKKGNIRPSRARLQTVLCH